MSMTEESESFFSSLVAKLYEKTSEISSSVPHDGLAIKKEKDRYEGFHAPQPECKKRKLVDSEEDFFEKSSAELVAETTEMTLKKMNIDPESKEGKIQRRKIRNRMSAQIHRERKKAYIEYLEGKVQERDEMITTLQKLLKESQLSNSRLRGEVSDLREKLNKEVDAAPLPIPSPADSSTSSESCSYGQNDGFTSQSSPENSSEYFSDCEAENFDDMMFRADSSSWLSDQNVDYGIELNGVNGIEDFPPSCEFRNDQRQPLSLFSLVLLVSFSFFTGMLSINKVGDLPYLASSSVYSSELSLDNPWLSKSLHPHSNLLGSNGFDSKSVATFGLISTSNSEYDSGKPSPMLSPGVKDGITSAKLGGRVLLSLSSDDFQANDEESSSSQNYPVPSSQWSQPDNSVSALEKGKGNFANSNPRNSSYSSSAMASLWQPQNFEVLGTIYERGFVERNRSDYPKHKKYLRFRNKNPSENAIANSYDIRYSPSTEKSVTLYRNHEAKGSNEQEEDEGKSKSLASYSKVLLSEGRVLLNPLLANLQSLGKTTERSRQTSNYDTGKAIIPIAPGSFGNTQSDQNNIQHNGTNFLTMVIPASSIQWGLEWEDGSSPDNSDMVMRHLLKNLNMSSMADQSSLDMSNLWLEIGCNVLQAKIIQNIL